MTTTDAPRESIPIALIQEAIENTLAIPNPDNISSLSITFNGTGQVNVIRFGKHGPYGETYAIDRHTVTCPQCHQELGRPHTDYCPLRLREETFAGIENAEYPGQPGVRVRAHERDSEVDGLVMAGLSGKWHQDGPDDAHPREQCDPTVCGWDRLEQAPGPVRL